MIKINEFVKIKNCDNIEFMKSFGNNHFDLAIVDPPYGINAGFGTNESMRAKIKNGSVKGGDWDSDVPNDEYFSELFRVSKNQIIWGGNYFSLPPSKCWLIWDKGESIYNKCFSEFKMAWTNFNKPPRIFKLFPNQLDRVHPTQKPIKLYEWILEKFANSGDGILDTNLGSGTIAIACTNFKFNLTACEKDTDYFNSSIDFIERSTKNQHLF